MSDLRRTITDLLEEAAEKLNKAHTLAAFGGQSTKRITENANQPLARRISEIHDPLDTLLDAMTTGEEDDDE